MEFNQITMIPDSLDNPDDAEPHFSSSLLKMQEVAKIEVCQDHFGKKFNWGSVQIYTNSKQKPAMIYEGITNPYQFKNRLELIIKNITMKAELRTHQPDTKMVEIPFVRTIKQRLSVGIVVLSLSGIALAGFLFAGSWYRTTIHDWDYCLQNDLCFVCHQPAPPTEFASDELRENVRLCPQHSTGWQSWRWVVYGVPAMLLMYQDAPMGTGKIFQPFLRWVVCVFWFIGVAISVVASIVSLLQLAIRKVEFFPWLDLREYSTTA